MTTRCWMEDPLEEKFSGGDGLRLKVILNTPLSQRDPISRFTRLNPRVVAMIEFFHVEGRVTELRIQAQL